MQEYKHIHKRRKGRIEKGGREKEREKMGLVIG